MNGKRLISAVAFASAFFFSGAQASAAGLPSPCAPGTAQAVCEQAAAQQQAVEELLKSNYGNLTGRAAAANKLLDIVKDKQEWTKEMLDQVASLGGDGVAVDELLPVISGCLKDSSGKPMAGAPVIGYHVMHYATADTMGIARLPKVTLSLTKRPGDAFFMIGAPSTPPFPIPDALLSREQRSLGAGCYLVPMKPDFVKEMVFTSNGIGVVGVPMDPLVMEITIFTNVPGFEAVPREKHIKITFPDEQVTVTETP